MGSIKWSAYLRLRQSHHGSYDAAIRGRGLRKRGFRRWADRSCRPCRPGHHLLRVQEDGRCQEGSPGSRRSKDPCGNDGAASTGQPARRLDIYPTPSAAESNALSIRYRAEFVEVASGEVDSTSLQIPVESHVEALYLEYVRAFAEGGEVGDTLQRVAMVDASPLLQEAMRRDGVETPNYGPLPMAVRGRTTSYGGLNFFPNGNIPDPS